ncbi:Fic family protein [Conexibacter sp. JD483]|uniref:Fic family protein n=1 Tax=unclassified Conexibacter TaxID=2627773 RepID=UPI00271A162C|nr:MULTISPECIES: Fic family protein [unclassified Conexibacter]MDO8189122.1 Fic family protein [Conexibacter sp. CPCC 205706]MDO8201887.1 Fic family protein [Conexibacter sp. CPCC 205762]MDR9371737.1 Fic family protein [Conexibacter sp. JD483]
MRGRYVHQIWQADPAIYAPPRYRRACAYDAFVPEPVADAEYALSGDVAGVVSDAEKAIADLNRESGPALMPLARLLLRTESIASSKVEGLQLDARSLARAEANQETGRKVGASAAEILANIDAMQLSIERAADLRGVRPVDFLDIHRVLMERAPNSEIAGQFRSSQNWIGGNDYNPCGAAFVPPPPEEVARLLDDLCAFVGDVTLPPLMQAAIAHAQFETVHPFADGNGRTGRALVQVVLRRRGLTPAFVPPISVVLARDKDRYLRGLTAFREDRVSEWVELFAAATAEAAQLAARYAGWVGELQETWRERLREHASPRADAAAWSLIAVLPAHPVITVPVAVAATGRTKPAVANAIEQLEEAGILSRLTDSPRNRAWEADGLLDLIVGLEAGVAA